MESDRKKLGKFDHLRFGLSMFALGAVFGLCLLIIISEWHPFYLPLLTGLSFWLFPLIWLWWYRLVERYVVKTVLFPVWRALGLIK